MDFSFFILSIAIVAGFYTAWNIGANDVANSMGTAVGSGSLTLKQAVILASIANFAGAVLVGGHVTDTIRKGMIDPSLFMDDPYLLVYGMLASLIAAGVWLHVATYFGLPVSTTHSIIGAVIGFGLISGGADSINWNKVAQVVVSWIVSPLTGGVFSFLMFFYIKKVVLNSHMPVRAAKRVIPYLTFYIAFILTLSLIYKGLKNLHLDFSFISAFLIAICCAFITINVVKAVVKRVGDRTELAYEKQLVKVEGMFKYLQILTAAYMAFAHGANDVANSIGPLAAIVSVLKHNAVMMKVEVPFWVLCLGGTGIAVGISTWGYKVIATIGKNITEITPSRGFCAEFGAATTVLICSRLGLPISSTHTLIGSVIGVGMARGMTALNFGVIKNIILSWVVTLPITGVITILIYRFFVVIF